LLFLHGRCVIENKLLLPHRFFRASHIKNFEAKRLIEKKLFLPDY